MSEVNARDHQVINTVEDMLHLYQGAGEDAKSGVEIEMAFIDPASDALTPMTISQNKVLKHSAAAALPSQDWVHGEPTSELLEVAGVAKAYAQTRAAMADTQHKIGILNDKARKIGLKRSYFQELPDQTADALLANIMDVDRYQVMYAPYRADMAKCVQYFAVCKSNQVSVSAYTPDHMLENVRRLYVLAPFLFLLTDNSCGFREGRPFDGHAAMALRADGLHFPRGARGYGFGDMPRYVFTAQSGDEYVRAHIDHVMHNPLFMYYDMAGQLHQVPSGDWSVTFESLKARGLNIASNYYLAQSTLWPDVKVAALKNAAGDVTGHRYEARMFGVGMHQHQTAYMITAGLAFDSDFAAAVDDLLETYGFTGAADEVYARVMGAYAAARAHGGAFMDVPYGNGRMIDFARAFAGMVERSSLPAQFGEALTPLMTICETGCTDGKVNRALFSTLDDVKAFQRNYDSAIFDDPNTCARLTFAAQLAQGRAAGDEFDCAVALAG